MQRLAWLREAAPGSYRTSLSSWTCPCPSYLLSRFHMCKHLVRLANHRLQTTRHSLQFFHQLRRHHTAPFYHTPSIHDIEDPSEDVPKAAEAYISETEFGAEYDEESGVGSSASVPSGARAFVVQPR